MQRIPENMVSGERVTCPVTNQTERLLINEEVALVIDN